MSLYAVVVEEAEFDAWLARQAQPAAEPATPLARRGGEHFQQDGCGACHTVRGTAADGEVGPDLTHLGSRRTLAAGILPNDPETLALWLARPDSIKPGVHMPSFGMLPPGRIRALAAYLEALK
jgi:cytochrome c oxidase subunit 2